MTPDHMKFVMDRGFKIIRKNSYPFMIEEKERTGAGWKVFRKYKSQEERDIAYDEFLTYEKILHA